MPDISHNHSDALLIFAKWPKPGMVKTRLFPHLSEEEASGLYRCMLLDTLNATANLTGLKTLIFYDAEEEREAEFSSMAPDAAIFSQNGRNLGERLANAFATAFAAGCRSAVVIGTDSPHMPPERIITALTLLSEGGADVVFGPSEDGGYYLAGMNELRRELFAGIPWSSPETLAKSLEKAESLGLLTALLPPGFDLDRVEDLKRLAALEGRHLASRTMKFISGLGF